MSRVIKALAITVGVGVAVILLLFGFLMIDWGRSASRAERDDLVAQARSPDGHFVAEIRRLTTAMHGGPDKLYVILDENDVASGHKIYERTYECDDFSGFRLQWRSTNDLTITYGDCDAERERSKGNYRDFYYKEQNKVWQHDTAWQNVKITYEDSGHVAIR
jgi:hypothetical protein